MIRKVMQGAVVILAALVVIFGAGWAIYGVMLVWEYMGALFLAAH